ncbi:MAG TPA: twitch domain-containing radical SAM protein [Flavilitoribacter sp.]|nr:twitch domain-containing radical SAM protein [Flavilitoribacter sp.]HMQ87375.1 twitch domain-containing radical SAM protein [Flavilitoribacter sp.]
MTLHDIVAALRGQQPEAFLCTLPFFHLYNDSEGKWGLCCKAKPFDYSVNEVTPSEHLNSPLMHRIRQEMLDGGDMPLTQKYCWKCIEGEKKGIRTFRQYWNDFILSRYKPEENNVVQEIFDYPERPGEAAYPTRRILDVKLRIFGNQCNLSCYMCSPSNSSTRQQEVKKIRNGYWFDRLGDSASPKVFESQDTYDAFVEDIIGLLPWIRSIRIIGGEPFLLKNHFNFLDEVIKSGHSDQIILVYHTNLTRFNGPREKLFNYLDHFNHVYLYVSLDGVGGRNDYIRYGSDFGMILDNIRFFIRNPKIDMKIYATISMLNAGDVPHIISFYESDELNLEVSLNMVTGPDFLRAQHLPDEIKAIYRKRIEDSPYRDRCDAVLKMLNQERDENLFQVFLSYVRDLDAHRGSNLPDHWPEFESYYYIANEIQ